MKIRYATISKTGRRHNNEDAYKVIDMPQNNRFMGIVCDGMGGHSFGETASETVCNTISDFWKKHISTPDCDSKVTWRKRSIPTHSGWLYPLTFDAGKGLKEA